MPFVWCRTNNLFRYWTDYLSSILVLHQIICSIAQIIGPTSNILLSSNYRFDFGLGSDSIKSCKTHFSEDIWDVQNSLSKFNFLKVVWPVMKKLCRKSSGWLLCNEHAYSHGSNYFPSLFFIFVPYFTFYDSDPVRIWSLRSQRGCRGTAGYPGRPVLCCTT